MFSIPSSAPTLYFDTLDSTMEMGWRLEASLRHGTSIVAGHQTEGRGRFARSWQDIPGKSVLMSVFLRSAALDCSHGLGPYSLQTALAVVEALDDLIEAPLLIKWPNDVLLVDEEGGEKKLAGILLEAKAAWLAVGVGINVTAVPDGHKERSAALYASEIGGYKPIFFAETLREFFRGDGYGDEWVEKINARLCWKEKWVHLAEDPKCRGVLKSVQRDGSLLLEDERGSLRLYSGSVLLDSREH